MELKKYRLGEILELQRGYDLPSSQQKAGNVLVAGSNGIIGYHNEIRGNHPCITVGRSGSVGKVHYYEQPTWAHNTALFVKDFKGNNPQYLYYFLKNLHLDEMFVKGSSVVPSLDRKVVHSLVVPFHKEVVCQKRIALVLSNIDRKIELNRAINQNLEAMAKLLYDYWFVQFDFPNEEGKPYKSSGGEMVWNEKLKRDIPASWKTKAIEDIADVYNGATPSTVNEQNYGGDIVWITPKDLSDQKQKFVYQGERNISQAGYNSCSTHLLPPNTILMSSRAPIGLLSIAKTELCTNQGFKSFVPQAENISTYLYYYLNIHIKQIEQLGTGTTFKEVSREDVLKFPILKPSDAILDLWEERVSAFNNKQFEIQKGNEYLTKQRDELLPLLMNGQVSVNSDLSDD
ncbi:restriction endonuclease subunit S [Bacteroides fragilis]|nr:restriction endonuclease subunit S [Bacteroides fragilis]KAA4826124.1 restriction endonuclease subunit S [Bacteroides fragilis]KAA4827408.1 restriction endonuclease subunit S [Bacteroides fragilis]KAA4839109.1 restriction endonuclease subunit S [Bacteroides fragilis]KAA4851639.1 restriction endonuclease subunit S [Bacteroides fragilis]